jgi:hypothetical protein
MASSRADGAHSWTTRLVEYVKPGVDVRRAIEKALRLYRLVRQGARGLEFEQAHIANREKGLIVFTKPLVPGDASIPSQQLQLIRLRSPSECLIRVS